MKKIILALCALTAAGVALAQTVVIIFMAIGITLAGSLAIWVIDKNANSMTMRWVVLEGRNHHNWYPVLTNRVPVLPRKTEAFPAFFIYSDTNNIPNLPHLYRVRLADDSEIPPGYAPQLIPGSDVQPVLYVESGTNVYRVSGL